MKFKIHISRKDGIFQIAADELAAFCGKMTGTVPEITTEFGDGDFIILGSEVENPVVAQFVLEKKIEIPQFRSGSDDYYISSVEESGRQLLLLGGGRKRALMYAVYDFLECYGCSYFWDCDIVPEKKELKLSGFNIHKSPRFEYRGLRYFAHRGLHRFQPEHWTLDDWKHEINWILKKRLNMFMLRIGMDDIFQKAFPDIVPYPDENQVCEKGYSRSYNDRTSFWDLRERGKLRKALLEYAFERDLIHPEDTGTMTHWYSPTPSIFTEKMQPPSIPQAINPGGHGHVWDIRQDEWLENYFKLTEAHIKEYGKAEIFHTIGLAERQISMDPRTNQLWRLYGYRRINERLRQSYPDAPLLLASWTFYNEKWTEENMRELTSLLDPRNTLIFDYTTDSYSEQYQFMKWGIYKKFPWICGIFQGLEPENELRGNYDTIKHRLTLAADDPYCKGMVIWPEQSHTDVLMYEFFAANAWQPELLDIKEFLPRFCEKRYPQDKDRMHKLWFSFLPLIACGNWNWENFYSRAVFANLKSLWKITHYTLDRIEDAVSLNKRLKTGIRNSAESFSLLAEADLSNPLIKRDAIDMARTGAARLFQYLFLQFPIRKIQDDAEKEKILDLMRGICTALADILAADPDYSLNHSLQKLHEGGKVNPNFEETLKGNVEDDYCRSFVYELFPALYLPEFEAWAEFVRTGDSPEEAMKNIRENFYSTPLAEFKPHTEAAGKRLVENFRKIESFAAKTTKI